MSTITKPFLPSDRHARDADDFSIALTANYIALARNGIAADVLNRDFSGNKSAATILRTATDLADTTTSGWAGVLAGTSVIDAVLGAAGPSACGGLIAGGLRVSLDGVKSAAFPTLDPDDIAAGWIAQGDPIPVAQGTANGGATVTEHKLAVIVVISNEFADRAATDVVRVMKLLVGRAAVTALDAKIFSNDAAVEGTSPAGILANAPLAATAGGGMNAMAADIKLLINTLAAEGGGVSPMFIGDPGTVATIKALAGSKFDYPVLASNALTNSLVAVEAPSFVSAFGAVPNFSISQQAVLHMSTTPTALTTAGTPPAAAFPERSLYQTNCSAIRLIMRCGYAMRNSKHAQIISGLSW